MAWIRLSTNQSSSQQPSTKLKLWINQLKWEGSTHKTVNGVKNSLTPTTEPPTTTTETPTTTTVTLTTTTEQKPLIQQPAPTTESATINAQPTSQTPTYYGQ
uniref:Uncharacterized protein n=1 Tax=Panagrolaimus sp. ES5 TaxID=591445 RepID=A0AC34GFL1_9BILA